MSMVSARVTRLFAVLAVVCFALGGVQSPIVAASSSSEAATLGTGPSPVYESFKNGVPDNSNWVVGGSAFLTSGGADPSGAGWLRMTPLQTNQLGYAYYNVPFPLASGIVISFDYASWGGFSTTSTEGADGSSVFLFDGATTTFADSGFGGALGYVDHDCGGAGVSNGYVGIGLDDFGNYSLPYCNTTGPGWIPNKVGIRGSGNGSSGYNWLTGTSPLASALSFPHVVARPSQSGTQYRHFTITVSGDQKVTVQGQFGAQGGAQTLISQYDLTTAPGQEVLPATLKVGIAGANGGGDDNHEIRNVEILPLGPTLSTATSNVVVGQNVALSGTLFGMSEVVNLYWDNLAISSVSTATSSAGGRLSAKVKVPRAVGGPHAIFAVGATSGRTAQVAINVQPALTLSPTSASAGTSVSASGSGFSSKEPVILTWGSPSGAVLGTSTTNATGGFAQTSAIGFAVPSTVAGAYPVYATGQVSGAVATAQFTVQ